MKASKKLINIGGVLYFPVTKDIREYLELYEIDENPVEVEWEDEHGKYGKFISFWKKSEKSKEELKEEIKEETKEETKEELKEELKEESLIESDRKNN